MSWWEYTLNTVVTGFIVPVDFVYHRWLAGEVPEAARQDFKLPSASEGTPIPLVYGRCRVRSPSLVWFGNYLATGDKYSSSFVTDQETDHFSIDMLFSVGLPFLNGSATLLQLWAGDTVLTMTSDDDTPSVKLYSAGGEFNTNGSFKPESFLINGVFYKGTADQDVTNGTPSNIPDHGIFKDGIQYGTSYLDALVQNGDVPALADPHLNAIPAYKQQVMLFGHFAVGTTPQIPSFSLEVSGTSDSFVGSALATDANPAAVLYDLITSKWGKLGISTDSVDLASFQAAAVTLLAEGNGYSRSVEQYEDASSIIGDILKQIDAVLYQEPSTGKLVLRLIRMDYDVTQLDDINPDNAISVGSGWYSVQGWSETMNQVRLTFTDRQANYGDGMSFGQNMANIIAQGNRLRPLDIRYAGCCDAISAQKLASRELAVVSRPMVKSTITVNRSFYQKRPGDVVTLTWPELGIDHMVMRIASIDFGQLHDNKITINMLRDVFDVSVGAFPPP